MGFLIYLFLCLVVAWIHEMVESHSFWKMLLLSVFCTPFFGIVMLLMAVADRADQPRE